MAGTLPTMVVIIACMETPGTIHIINQRGQVHLATIGEAAGTMVGIVSIHGTTPIMEATGLIVLTLDLAGDMDTTRGMADMDIPALL